MQTRDRSRRTFANTTIRSMTHQPDWQLDRKFGSGNTPINTRGQRSRWGPHRLHTTTLTVTRPSANVSVFRLLYDFVFLFQRTKTHTNESNCSEGYKNKICKEDQGRAELFLYITVVKLLKTLYIKRPEFLLCYFFLFGRHLVY